ncbi:hypothetical protein BD324DRAFT_627984 [Kockovaella imperatae]|uniref:Uncharacterized protein n=1 Tax=Kockovaella imperatae TaxID=4999 RepID=A0A1Y1UDV7_9TREE|nr:hypothetical protein BD324DRAFT_627984 [Kockovaella imperatae]ORX36231.1 hypothetical protein BD324DRAFT_627984 [Kockovaella imperatae]
MSEPADATATSVESSSAAAPSASVGSSAEGVQKLRLDTETRGHTAAERSDLCSPSPSASASASESDDNDDISKSVSRLERELDALRTPSGQKSLSDRLRFDDLPPISTSPPPSEADTEDSQAPEPASMTENEELSPSRSHNSDREWLQNKVDKEEAEGSTGLGPFIFVQGGENKRNTLLVPATQKARRKGVDAEEGQAKEVASTDASLVEDGEPSGSRSKLPARTFEHPPDW